MRVEFTAAATTAVSSVWESAVDERLSTQPEMSSGPTEAYIVGAPGLAPARHLVTTLASGVTLSWLNDGTMLSCNVTVTRLGW